MKRNHTFILLFLINILSGCFKPPQTFVDDASYHIIVPDGKPDYSDLRFWAAHPYKHDPSDSLPQELIANYRADSTVDVFFVHPTTYTSNQRSNGWNASLEDVALNSKTDYSSILFQASIFNQAGRVFAPRYRQAHLSAYFPKNREDSLEASKAFELAYGDVKAAFEYYLAHYNSGRPIVIASHSQGSTHTKRLLKEFFENKPLQKQLVAAYIIGMVVEQNYFTSIPPCEHPSQTGCICSWRTFKNNFTPEFVELEKTNAIVTNPLTWDVSKPKANRDLNKGGVLLNFNKTIKKVADATVTDKILWTGKPHFFGNLFYTTKNYHVADLNLFYLSIRENVQTRIGAFRKK